MCARTKWVTRTNANYHTLTHYMYEYLSPQPLANQHVASGQIAVHNPSLPKRLHPQRHLVRDEHQCFGAHHDSLCLQPRVQGPAHNVLHQHGHGIRPRAHTH